MSLRIKRSEKKRVVIVGGGFGGLQLAKKLLKSNYQIVLLDINNFHQFQPLFYQVATSGLEPSSIIFPFRKIFQKTENVHFRMARVEQINREEKKIETDKGSLKYDYLVLAQGAGNNFFGNESIANHAIPMKSINESLRLRNIILERFEESLGLNVCDRKEYLTMVVVGGGPTGVELAGTLAEMKKFVLPKDYPELDFDQMRIILIEAADRVLSAMSEKASEKAFQYLIDLGVDVRLKTLVENYDGSEITFKKGHHIKTKTMIWAAGIKANQIDGLTEEQYGPGGRIKVNEFNKVVGTENIFAIGDTGIMEGDKSYPKGHPQLAQAAIQQATLLAKNLIKLDTGGEMKPFHYKNLGSMATVGRNKAVVDLPKRSFFGFSAWLVWMLVHLRSILGVKNKWIIFINWVWNYITYNLSLRLIIKRNDKVS